MLENGFYWAQYGSWLCVAYWTGRGWYVPGTGHPVDADQLKIISNDRIEFPNPKMESGYYWVKPLGVIDPCIGRFDHTKDWWIVVERNMVYPPNQIEVLSDRLLPPE